MRNQWRLLLRLRCQPRSPHQQPHISRHISYSSNHQQVHALPQELRAFSFHRPRVDQAHAVVRHFSSSPQLPTEDQPSVLLTDIFTKSLSKTNEEIKLDLESNNIVITHDLVLNALKNLNAEPDVAKRFFNWLLETNKERLSSKAYNLMLGILGTNGFVKEFWEMVFDMKVKGYGVSKNTSVRVREKFEQEGLNSDVEKLDQLYASGSISCNENSVEKVCGRVCKVIRSSVWGEDVEKRLRDLNVDFSSELVSMVLEVLEGEVNKGLIFFRWLEESGLFKHDGRTFNAMARMLGREVSEKFWRMINEMRRCGYDMERDTYVKVSEGFVKKRMIKEAVDLYEFAMIGSTNKPSVQDSTILLKKIVVSKEMDMELFVRVVRIYKESGNVLTNGMLDAVLKSLTSVGRIGECNKILKAMEEGGFLPNGASQSKIAFQLSSSGETEELHQFIDNMEASGCNPDSKTWVSLIEGHCVAGELDKAADGLRKMIEKEGVQSANYALEMLVSEYCRKKRARNAYKLVSEMVNEKELRPWHTTYKVLIAKLLAQRGFRDALEVLGLMKTQGYPPFLEPFINYLPKSGSPEDAIAFTKAMTVKRFPSTAVYLHMFEAYFKAGKTDKAQDFLSKCPRYIRSHADVLNLFYSMKSKGNKAGTAVAA